MAAAFSPPAVDFYSMLSGLGDTLQANAALRQKQQVSQARQDAFSNFTALDPNSPDYGKQSLSIAQKLGAAGDQDGAVKFLTLAQTNADRLHTAQREGVTDSHWNQDYALRKSAALRADEDKLSLEKIPDASGNTSAVAFNPRTGETKPVNLPSAAPQPSAGLTGPEYLASLPPDQATIVKKIADHEVDPNKLSIVGGHRERLIGMASRYDPEYDASLAPARFAAKKEFLTGGPNAPSSTIVSGGTTIGHLLHASDASQKLGGVSGYGPLTSPINKMRAGYEESSNDPNFKEYNTTIGRIAEEGTKFYRGVGGTESDIMRDIKTMEPGQSQESRDRALATQASLIYSKVAALQDRYKNAMGTKAWERVSKENNFPVISAKNREAVNVILKRGGLPELSPEPAKGGTQGNGGDMILQHARDALAQGAPKEAVFKRLQEAGIDPGGL